MNKEYDYYIPDEGGPTHKLIVEFVNERLKAHAARKAFQDEFEADGTYGTESHFDGIVYKAGSNKSSGLRSGAWRSDKNASTSELHVYVPNKRTPEGKAMAKRMASPEYVYPGAMNFHASVFPIADSFGIHIGPGDRGGIRVAFATFEILDGKYILAVPRKYGSEKEVTPGEDCKPLKQSEYWAMKEAAEQQKAAA
jgi:hypothetical protein